MLNFAVSINKKRQVITCLKTTNSTRGFIKYLLSSTREMMEQLFGQEAPVVSPPRNRGYFCFLILSRSFSICFK